MAAKHNNDRDQSGESTESSLGWALGLLLLVVVVAGLVFWGINRSSSDVDASSRVVTNMVPLEPTQDLSPPAPTMSMVINQAEAKEPASATDWQTMTDGGDFGMATKTVDLVYKVVVDVIPDSTSYDEFVELLTGVERINGIPDADISVTTDSVTFRYFSRPTQINDYSLADFSAAFVDEPGQVNTLMAYAVEATRLECNNVLRLYPDQTNVCRLVIITGAACQNSICQADLETAINRWQQADYETSIWFFPTADLQEDEPTLDFYAQYGPVIRASRG